MRRGFEFGKVFQDFEIRLIANLKDFFKYMPEVAHRLVVVNREQKFYFTHNSHRKGLDLAPGGEKVETTGSSFNRRGLYHFQGVKIVIQALVSINSSCLPTSVTRPLSSTMILSALRTVVRRCAMTTVVRFAINRSRAS